MKKKIEIFVMATAFSALVAYFVGQISGEQQLDRNQYTGLKTQLLQAGQTASETQKILNDLIKRSEEDKITEEETTLLKALRKKGINMQERDFFFEVDGLSKAMLHECPYHNDLCSKEETYEIAKAIIKTAKKRKEPIADTVKHKVNGGTYFLSYHSEIPLGRQQEAEKTYGTQYFKLALKILASDYDDKDILCQINLSAYGQKKSLAVLTIKTKGLAQRRKDYLP